MAAKALFKLDTLHKVSHLAEDFEALVTEAVRDCKARPGMQKPREIKIVVKITPHKQTPDDVVVQSSIGAKTPTREADPYLMQTTVNNGLKFAPMTPMDPDQGELFEE